jgi:CDP-paratose 2-epimerase
MKAVVTGAAGFIGTNMVRRLYKEGIQVIAVDSLARVGTPKNLVTLQEDFPDLHFEQKEIEDMPAVIHRERPDVVFHFAAQVAVTSSVISPARDFKINAEGSVGVTLAAHEVGAPVIYTSTNKVYGDNVNHVPIQESESRYDFEGEYFGAGLPENFSIDASHHTPYGISKLIGELYVREYGGIANRCSCMYGPYQFGVVDQGWMSHIATNKLLGRQTTIYGDGKQIRDALHVDDVMNLLIAQMKALTGPEKAKFQGQVYNVGGAHKNTISLIELCRRWDIEPVFGEWRPADQKVFYCDISKAAKDFGWSPAIGLDQGLTDLFEWTKRSVAAMA